MFNAGKIKIHGVTLPFWESLETGAKERVKLCNRSIIHEGL
jgi:hypothetical protein